MYAQQVRVSHLIVDVAKHPLLCSKGRLKTVPDYAFVGPVEA